MAPWYGLFSWCCSDKWLQWEDKYSAGMRVSVWASVENEGFYPPLKKENAGLMRRCFTLVWFIIDTVLMEDFAELQNICWLVTKQYIYPPPLWDTSCQTDVSAQEFNDIFNLRKASCNDTKSDSNSCFTSLKAETKLQYFLRYYFSHSSTELGNLCSNKIKSI